MAAAETISHGIVRVGVYGVPSDGESAPDDEDGECLPRDVSRHIHEDVCLLIVGHCLLDSAERKAALAAVARNDDLGQVTAWPGAHSAIVLRGETVTAYADLSDQFPLYYSKRGDEILIAADLGALAAAHSRQPDPLALAMHVACPGVLPLWQRRSPYAGISRLPAGAILRATPGSVQVQPGAAPLPVADRSLEEGAALLRGALVRAVDTRCAGRQISADFSGGFDSTSVTFLAAASARPPVAAVAYHQPLAPAWDLEYAKQYAAFDTRLRLTVVGGTEHTLPFVGAATSGIAASEPHPGWLAAERSLARLAAAREWCAQLHLTGEGGDAILTSAPSYLATFARRGEPLTLLRHSGAYARLRQVSPAAVVGQAVRLAGVTAQRALSDLATQLAGSAPLPGRWVDSIAWWPPAGEAAWWLTPSIRRQLADVAADPATARAMPPGASPADLAALTDVRRSGDAQRQLRELAAPLGLEVHAPFLDSTVIRAALSVPAQARANPWAYKPLLGAALGDLVPAEILRRRTKGDYAAEDYAGARAALPWLRAQIRDSRLATLGVIEPCAVTVVLDRMAAGVAVPLGPLNMLLATEYWLRSTEESRSGACAAC
jgi:asparagine synthase (glutamine-hydrolysing)